MYEDSGYTAVLFVICFVFILALTFSLVNLSGDSVPKHECEKELPRHIECTWQPPKEITE